MSVSPWLCLASILGGALSRNVDATDVSTNAAPDKTEVKPGDGAFKLEPATNVTRNWSLQFGVALISNNSIDEVFTEVPKLAKGDDGGQLYSLTLNWTAHRFEIPWREGILRPEVAPYLTLTLVDENSGPFFPDYNGGGGIRWVDFPWDKWVATTFFMGIGLSYSSQVYAVDRSRHPGEERSHLKFDWPIQFTFAVPRWRQHQLVLFIDHQSGGHIFDNGGINAFGLGYRWEF